MGQAGRYFPEQFNSGGPQGQGQGDQQDQEARGGMQVSQGQPSFPPRKATEAAYQSCGLAVFIQGFVPRGYGFGNCRVLVLKAEEDAGQDIGVCQRQQQGQQPEYGSKDVGGLLGREGEGQHGRSHKEVAAPGVVGVVPKESEERDGKYRHENVVASESAEVEQGWGDCQQQAGQQGAGLSQPMTREVGEAHQNCAKQGINQPS